MVELNNYPEQVVERVNEFLESMELTGAFEVIDSTPKLVGDSLGMVIFEGWVLTGDLEITEEQFTGAIFRAEMEQVLIRMVEDGLIGELDDEQIFLTEKGKELTKSFLN
jgi:hypothetical protein